ncbi:unnamed protein product [Bursaphelenchus okinawaensis]|uniref:Uncharacterized protein n=1 Tax=Bursaphelenchus okinawaensis TaxID=465554 RepID=A0A811L9X5_9BILA|nr:unnamed protein product [Bursaphelenchus okinawaensis]CAG9120395.1 unnamed protein product [Bursaphelenchus okinawaensis]
MSDHSLHRIIMRGLVCCFVFTTCNIVLAREPITYESLVPDFEEQFEKKASEYTEDLTPKEKEIFLSSSKVNASTELLLEATKEPHGYAKTMELASQILRDNGYSEDIIELYYDIFVLMPRLGDFLHSQKSVGLRKGLQKTGQLFQKFSSADRRRLLEANSDAVDSLEDIFALNAANALDEIVFQKLFALLIRPEYRQEFFERVVKPADSGI